MKMVKLDLREIQNVSFKRKVAPGSVIDLSWTIKEIKCLGKA